MKTENISQLRPLAEAGPVPEGCVRHYTYKQDGEWTPATKHRAMQDTHYIDIRLPESEPLVTKSDSSPEWTPQVGDVVRLKSGGPLMTVGKVSDETEIFCFRGDDLMKTSIPTACLKLSTKENA